MVQKSHFSVRNIRHKKI